MTKKGEEASPLHDPDKKGENANSGEKAPKVKPRRNIFWRVQKFGYRHFPSVIPDPERKEILEEYRKHDDEKNQKSTAPLDEEINLRCVWAAEIYTPSQISQLLRAFEELGWNTDDPLAPDRNPSQWVRQNRESARGGGWLNLGPIERPEKRKLLSPSHLTASLPSGVEYALGRMYSLTSSITCIVIVFVLDDSFRRRFELELRKKRKTYLKSLKRGGSHIIGPVDQKKESINAVRAELEKMAAAWFRSNLPGLFAGGVLDGNYPTCEFLTLSHTIPFPAKGENSPDKEKWLHILDIDYDLFAWRAKESPELKFSWLLRPRGTRFYAVVSGKEKDFSEERLKSYGGVNNTSYVFYVDQFVNALLSRWSLLAALSGFERYLNKVRDSANFDLLSQKKRATYFFLFKGLISHFTKSVDMSAASVELQNFASHKPEFEHNISAFSPCNSTIYWDKKILLIEVLRNQIIERANWLQNIDRSVRDILIQYGTVLGTRENIKLQKRLWVLTWVIVFLTVVLTILAIMGPFGKEIFSGSF